MKKCIVSILLILAGGLPFLAGGIMNDLMFTSPYTSILYSSWFSVAFLVVWGVLSWIASRFTTSIKATLIPLHLVPFLNLLLSGIQLLIVGRYWSNWYGLWNQYFYLPVLRLASEVTAGWLTTMFPIFCICFLLMLGASFVGAYLQKKRQPG